MLTGKMVRVRYARDRIIPQYLDGDDAQWLATAEQLLLLFRTAQGKPRGELETEIDEMFGDAPNPQVYQGLAKLLEDRCEFEVVSGHPPEELRAAVFRAAAERRQAAAAEVLSVFDRKTILEEVAANLKLEVAVVDHGLFADLKSEQRLAAFRDLSPEHLLQRYNVGLAQAVVLRATGLEATIRGETPARYRQFFRLVKFHRLVCEAETLDGGAFLLRLDGPMSLFTATQKYGLQLALFLPALLRCKDFELKADLLWGPQRRPKKFLLSSADGLVSHHVDTGMYTPPELAMFVELFRKKIADWEIEEETDIVALGGGFWVPDFRLVEKATGRAVFLEVLGFWRKSSAEKHLQRLREHCKQPFVLALSEQFKVDEHELVEVPAWVHRFRTMPLPDEIVRLARRFWLLDNNQPDAQARDKS